MASDTYTGTALARSAARRTGTDIPIWIAILLVLAASGGSGYLGARWAAEDLRTELILRPHVVLFDMAGAVRGVVPDRLAAVVAREKARADRLADAGFLVLDAQAVIAAPADLQIDVASARDDRGGLPR
jgi:hypothetical protein